ncbi:hypothetical protein KAFR_0C05120 [Kazachstania africana CBS 2517]|uniref:Uncharacterized protein n=1 Tax=Kazachstania africana (strain ATCC 22294 / BCRC 22015 / CBS 2517 / CECT 1963 / NBRC 1671 / NRRL Y-8276) TaxID=1071382 RepID=H2AT03_KAZAF|nr:hypothetical protein KAFR_0C05120 [Kazachstania africana CBS 2517]CCF57503.1 hypothetical protein KAFR_0C05120 [Kazachstania africana CBS 2517]
MQSEPETPLHAQPDEHLNLNDLKELDQQDIADLDLNPGLEDSIPATPIPSGINIASKRSLDDTTNEIQFDNFEDFAPQVNIRSPFSSNTNLSSLAHTLPDLDRSTRLRQLSMSQQSKFISYVDQQLLAIQRKFVQSRGLNDKLGYVTLSELLKDVKALLDFIWYSIDGLVSTEHLLQFSKEELNSKISSWEQEVLQKDQQTVKSSDFGQTYYIMRIADDLMDYVEKFEIAPSDRETISKLFKLFFILDRIFKLLIVGLNANNIKLNQTDVIRFIGIAERSRMKLPLFFEHCNIHGYHFELSKIYEESLDLCPC